MTDITVSLTKEEYNLVMAALVQYRLKGFPLGRSSPSATITWRDRQYWAKLGMQVYNKLYGLRKEA